MESVHDIAMDLAPTNLSLPGLDTSSSYANSILTTFELKKMHSALRLLVENQLAEIRQMKSDLYASRKRLHELNRPDKKEVPPSASTVMAVIAPDAMSLEAALVRAKSNGHYFAIEKTNPPFIHPEAQAREEFENHVKFDYRLFRWDANKEHDLLHGIAHQMQSSDFSKIESSSDEAAVLKWFQEEEERRKERAESAHLRKKHLPSPMAGSASKRSTKRAKYHVDDDGVYEYLWKADPCKWIKIIRLGQHEQAQLSVFHNSFENFADPINWNEIEIKVAPNQYQPKPTPAEMRAHFWQYSRPSRSDFWSKEEVSRLMQIVDESPNRPWTVIAQVLNMEFEHSKYRDPPCARSPFECIQKYYGADRNQRNSWTPKEDEMLTKLVREHGQKKWQFIAGIMGHRTGPQCMHRWTKALSSKNLPKIKGAKKTQPARRGRRAQNADDDEDADAEENETTEGNVKSYWNFNLDRLLIVSVKAYKTETGDDALDRLLDNAENATHQLGDETESEEPSVDVPVTPARRPRAKKAARKDVQVVGTDGKKLPGRPPVETSTRWSMVQLHIPGKLDTQCRERYTNTVDPSIDHSDLTNAEVALLVSKVIEHRQNARTKAAEAIGAPNPVHADWEDGGEDPDVPTPWAAIQRANFPRRTDAQLSRHWRKLVVAGYQFSKTGAFRKPRNAANGGTKRKRADSDDDMYDADREQITKRPVAKKPKHQKNDDDEFSSSTASASSRRKSARTPKPKKTKFNHPDDETDESDGEDANFVLPPSLAPSAITQGPLTRNAVRSARHVLEARDSITSSNPEVLHMQVPMVPTDIAKMQSCTDFLKVHVGRVLEEAVAKGYLYRPDRTSAAAGPASTASSSAGLNEPAL